MLSIQIRIILNVLIYDWREPLISLWRLVGSAHGRTCQLWDLLSNAGNICCGVSHVIQRLYWFDHNQWGRLILEVFTWNGSVQNLHGPEVYKYIFKNRGPIYKTAWQQKDQTQTYQLIRLITKQPQWKIAAI